MKCSSCLSLSVVAAVALASVTAAPCNLGEIQGKLFPNATEGLKKCATSTGFDVWAISAFPTAEQAQKIMTTRDCVDFLNQINQRANKEIRCEVNIGGVEKDFGGLLVNVLTGKTGNQTESSSSGSAASGSDDIQVPTKTPRGGSSSSSGTTSPKPTKAPVTTPKTTPKAASASTPTTHAVTSVLFVAAATWGLQG